MSEWSCRDPLQRLATSPRQATTFLVRECSENEMEDNPVFTVADGILWLYQSVDRNSSVRKLQALKMRGQAPLPGLHTMRIIEDGVRCSRASSSAWWRPTTPAEHASPWACPP